VSENSTTASRYLNSSTKDSSKMETSPYSVLTIHQVCTMLLGLILLTTSMFIMNEIKMFQGKLSELKNYFLTSWKKGQKLVESTSWTLIIAILTLPLWTRLRWAICVKRSLCLLNLYNTLMMKLGKLLSVSFLLLILVKLGILKILMFFVILLLGVLMNLLIFRDIPSEQQRSQPEHVVR